MIYNLIAPKKGNWTVTDNQEDFSKEIELTSAIDAVKQKTGLIGAVLDGKMFDMGKPDAFKKCIMNY